MHDNLHIADLKYMHMFKFQFIYAFDQSDSKLFVQKIIN